MTQTLIETHSAQTIYAGYEDRYSDYWRSAFRDVYTPFLEDARVILDVGSGRTPLIATDMRPSDATYVGLDISAEELHLAPSGSYDLELIQDIVLPISGLPEEVDLALSWQVLEHVRPLSQAVENVRAVLQPGGAFISLLSGRNAHFAILNRIVPEALGKAAMRHLLGREPDTVFHAEYDNCTYNGLQEVFKGWKSVEIVPIYRGAGYWRFSRPLRWTYLKYENWLVSRDKRDLATHYVVVARK